MSAQAGENAPVLEVESVPDVAASAREAARGQVIYITEHGERLAAIVPASVVAWLQKMPSDAFAALFQETAALSSEGAIPSVAAAAWRDLSG
jgi:antitoxin (DNA-binding transcriptional repressor) of toxin-antitoxin stability system